MVSTGPLRTTAQRPALPELDDPEVWILEDSAVDGEAARRNLPGMRVRLFSDGATLLEESTRGELPDVVVLDWELPSLSGLDVCRFLRRSHDRLALPIIMVTAHREESFVVEAFAAGSNDYIAKPYSPAEFVARVQAAARTGRVYATLLDTYARLEHERALLTESESRYRALADAGVIGIIESDLRGRVVSANDAYLAIIGCTRAEFAAGRLSEPGASSPMDARALRELVEFGVSGPYEREIEGDGGVPAVVKVAAVRLGPQSDRCIAFVLDVTNERQIEADRARLYAAERRARADAEIASRMKDEFLAIVSHELRTPMNAVLGWASLLQARLADDPEASKPLEVIQRNARLQAKLIDDILDVSRIVSGKVRLDPRELDLAAVIDQALEAIRPAAEAKNIAIERRIPEALPGTIGDPDRLQQVVWNLVSNAVKFTPAGGRVIVAVRSEPDHLVIDVIDDGAGIPAEHLLAIFERFRQIDGGTTRIHGGLGLGLAIVRQLVEMHGGTVSAHSAGLGHGATFTVRLDTRGAMRAAPVAPPRPRAAPPPAAAPGPPPVAVPSLAGVVVVVVDDEADSRAFTSTALREAGAEVVECSDADQGVAAVAGRRPDVLVSDISMPHRDGYSLIREVRELAPERGGDTVSVAVTAHARDNDVARCLAAGFDRHLAKPVEANELVRCVASCSRDARSNRDRRAVRAP